MINKKTKSKTLYSVDKIDKILNKGTKLEKFIMYLDNVHCNGRIENDKFLKERDILILKSYIACNEMDFKNTVAILEKLVFILSDSYKILSYMSKLDSLACYFFRLAFNIIQEWIKNNTNFKSSNLNTIDFFIANFISSRTTIKKCIKEIENKELNYFYKKWEKTETKKLRQIKLLNSRLEAVKNCIFTKGYKSQILKEFYKEINQNLKFSMLETDCKTPYNNIFNARISLIEGVFFKNKKYTKVVYKDFFNSANKILVNKDLTKEMIDIILDKKSTFSLEY